MNLLTVDEKIQCLKNLLSGSEIWINPNFSSSSDDEPETYDRPVGINPTSPEARKGSLRPE
jgi:hypothetical protein